MKHFINRCIRYALRQIEYYLEIGFDVKKIKRARRLKKRGVHYNRFALFDKRWLLDCNIRTVVDIGASIGEFTAIFAELFPNARIYSFEPLPNCFAQLEQIASYYNNVKPFNIALGSTEGKQRFCESSWAPASSFRKMTALHKQIFPHSADSEILIVEIKTLDKIFENANLEENILVKMDVQGYEDEVIKGGMEIIKKAKVLVIECSLQKFYEDEPMFHGIYTLLHSLGFAYKGSIKQSVSNKDDSYMQADCIFIKSSELKVKRNC